MLYNVSMEKRENNVLWFLAIILAGVCTGLALFAGKAVEKGRLLELVITSAILCGTYYVMYYARDSISAWWVWLVPFCVFIVCWGYLFSHEKITCPHFNPCWGDKSWWWRLDGWEFEEEVAKIFRLNGYTAEVTKKTGDGGADIILYKDKDKYAVQCKHWRQEVPVSCVRELKGVQEDLCANKLIMVASSGVTSDSKKYLRNKPYYKVLTLDDIMKMAMRPISHTL